MKNFPFRTAITMLLMVGIFSINTTHSQSIDESLYEAQEYRLIGPFRGGRSAAVAGVPDKPNLFYFGATGGGVWKTVDGGRHWENISDGFFGGSIGSVVVSSDDPNVIYVGGGETTVRGNVSSGYGVWKTVDAGKTWKSMGLKKSRHIPRMVVHPKDHNVVFAAVLGNIFKPTKENYNNSLIDMINALATISDGVLLKINGSTNGENLIGNPSYGRWTNHNGVSVWTWFAGYMLFKNIFATSPYYSYN